MALSREQVAKKSELEGLGTLTEEQLSELNTLIDLEASQFLGTELGNGNNKVGEVLNEGGSQGNLDIARGWYYSSFSVEGEFQFNALVSKDAFISFGNLGIKFDSGKRKSGISDNNRSALSRFYSENVHETYRITGSIINNNQANSYEVVNRQPNDKLIASTAIGQEEAVLEKIKKAQDGIPGIMPPALGLPILKLPSNNSLPERIHAITGIVDEARIEQDLGQDDGANKYRNRNYHIFSIQGEDNSKTHTDVWHVQVPPTSMDAIRNKTQPIIKAKVEIGPDGKSKPPVLEVRIPHHGEPRFRPITELDYLLYSPNFADRIQKEGNDLLSQIKEALEKLNAFAIEGRSGDINKLSRDILKSIGIGRLSLADELEEGKKTLTGNMPLISVSSQTVNLRGQIVAAELEGAGRFPNQVQHLNSDVVNRSLNPIINTPIVQRKQRFEQKVEGGRGQNFDVGNQNNVSSNGNTQGGRHSGLAGGGSTVASASLRPIHKQSSGSASSVYSAHKSSSPSSDTIIPTATSSADFAPKDVMTTKVTDFGDDSYPESKKINNPEKQNDTFDPTFINGEVKAAGLTQNASGPKTHGSVETHPVANNLTSSSNSSNSSPVNLDQNVVSLDTEGGRPSGGDGARGGNEKPGSSANPQSSEGLTSDSKGSISL